LCYKISAIVFVYLVLSQHTFLACVGFVKVCQKWKRLFMVLVWHWWHFRWFFITFVNIYKSRTF